MMIFSWSCLVKFSFIYYIFNYTYAVWTSRMGLRISGVAKLSCLLFIFLCSFSYEYMGFFWSSVDMEFQNHLVLNTSHVPCTFFQGTVLLENVSSGTEVARIPQTSQMLIGPYLIYFCIHCLIQNRHQGNKCLGRKWVDWSKLLGCILTNRF